MVSWRFGNCKGEDQRVKVASIYQKWTIPNLQQVEVTSAWECNSSARWLHVKLWQQAVTWRSVSLLSAHIIQCFHCCLYYVEWKNGEDKYFQCIRDQKPFANHLSPCILKATTA